MTSRRELLTFAPLVLWRSGSALPAFLSDPGAAGEPGRYTVRGRITPASGG